MNTALSTNTIQPEFQLLADSRQVLEDSGRTLAATLIRDLERRPAGLAGTLRRALASHPASMTHAGLSQEQRAIAGISDELIRLSVGCEGVEDIRADLAQALDKA